MYPVPLVEELLGSIESWPCRVISDMFDTEPTVRVSWRVAEFLYSNGVNVSDAVKLYRTCKYACKAIAEKHMYNWYFHWEKGVRVKFQHNFYYYNVKRKCVMWIRRDESMTPEIIVRNFLLAGFRYPGTMELRIAQVRMMEWKGE